MPFQSKFDAAVHLFDAANGEDPHLIGDVPAELLYARRMTDWLDRLYPEATEPLKLAARSQHIRRWMIPRNTFPITRAGYHQWRTKLYSFHAQTAAEILKSVDYDQPTIDRVGQMLRKEKLKADGEVQALEDVACLVFLENYFADFAARHEEEKVVGIIKRTWAKMSKRGQDAAMKLELNDAARRLIGIALG